MAEDDSGVDLLSTLNNIMGTNYEDLDGIPARDLTLLSAVLLGLVVDMLMQIIAKTPQDDSE